LNAYKKEDGSWLDSDQDGIIDAIESSQDILNWDCMDDLPGIESVRELKDHVEGNSNDEYTGEEILQKQLSNNIYDKFQPIIKNVDVDGGRVTVDFYDLS